MARFLLILLAAYVVVGFADVRAVGAEIPQRPNAYAIVVGSNRAGPGQQDLRFAHADARRVLAVITEVGGYSRDNAVLVLDPGKEGLLASISRIKSRLDAHASKGEESMLLFYFSGHARSAALNLGQEELALAELRRRLVALPSTVTIAILDACQTGAISRVKGAQPTADFSYNSVNRLNTAGIAVMASSAASELSQETDTLGSSYFTHHLVTGLRGAADANRDGGITLSEAYRYAYNRTLVSTASTAVGKQHVTLETKLRGKGEMVLTYPARASSRLELPAGLSGQVLVHRQPDQTVMAELHKTKGGEVRLALPHGQYVAYLRRDRQVLRCELRLSPGSGTRLAIGQCERASPDQVGIKGRSTARTERWALEFGVGGVFGLSDDYNQRLEHFGFEKELFQVDEFLSFNAALMYSFTPHVSLVLGYNRLDSSSYNRSVYDLQHAKHQQAFSWSAHGITVSARGTLPLLDGLLNPYLQAGIGFGWGLTEYKDPLQGADTAIDDEVQWGYVLSAALGLHVMPWKHFGFFAQGSYTRAPLMGNLIGDVHDSGGPAFNLGFRGCL